MATWSLAPPAAARAARGSTKRSRIVTVPTWGSAGSSDAAMTPADVSPGDQRPQTFTPVASGGATAFVRMLLAETGRFKTQLIICTVAAGLATATLMVIVNSVADRRSV